ncbi:hypothetical protein B0T10DRAFT_551397 [Thelonectria olida]|uniref:Uncharacterized protein n=1 Tax=Thelonectria olida TaxID=1576542 RepID=A0A9P8VW72_9HYPO|nr:hypothetical protein B0T10DRAFT_551397 [Thelonectria olida]
MAYIRFHLAFWLAVGVSALNQAPDICAWEPSPVTAGSVRTAGILNPFAARCEAVLDFDNPNYLPITWSFDAVDCEDVQIAQFTLPLAVPNGGAYITWDCEGDITTCNHIVITNGNGNPDSVPLQQVGVVGCVPQSMAATATTLTTRTLPLIRGQSSNLPTEWTSAITSISSLTPPSSPTSTTPFIPRYPTQSSSSASGVTSTPSTPTSTTRSSSASGIASTPSTPTSTTRSSSASGVTSTPSTPRSTTRSSSASTASQVIETPSTSLVSELAFSNSKSTSLAGKGTPTAGHTGPRSTTVNQDRLPENLNIPNFALFTWPSAQHRPLAPKPSGSTTGEQGWPLQQQTSRPIFPSPAGSMGVLPRSRTSQSLPEPTPSKEVSRPSTPRPLAQAHSLGTPRSELLSSRPGSSISQSMDSIPLPSSIVPPMLESDQKTTKELADRAWAAVTRAAIRIKTLEDNNDEMAKTVEDLNNRIAQMEKAMGLYFGMN